MPGAPRKLPALDLLLPPFLAAHGSGSAEHPSAVVLWAVPVRAPDWGSW